MNYTSLRKTGLKCLNPVRIKNPDLFYKDGTMKRLASSDDAEGFFVPCGKCYVCLSARRQQWAFRLSAESDCSYLSLFVTLTLDDEHLHDVCKSDLQLHFKRLRKKGLIFRYYAIGEYGTRTQRPHYHYVLFVKNDIDYESVCEMITYDWQSGFCYFGEVNSSSINYVLHYHVRPKEVNGKFTFALSSKGLGIDYFTPDMLHWFVSKGNYNLRTKEGVNGFLPRYYRKKFDLPTFPFSIDFNYDSVDDSTDYLFEMRKKNKMKFNMYNEQDKF